MKIRILAFGIAKDILGARHTQIEVPAESLVGDLRKVLIARHPTFDKLNSLRFAVAEEYVEDDTNLQENDQVVIIPPVSGG